MKKKILVSFLLLFGLTLTAAQTPVSAVSNQMQQIRDSGKQQIESLRQKFMSDVKAVQDQVKTKIETEKENFQTKLQGIKDTVKKNAVSRIQDSLTNLNQKLTNQYSSVLDKLADVLGRISSRTDKVQAKGIDVSSVRTAITNAQTAIAAARDAVKAQMGKTYTVDLTNATSTASVLKNVVGNARQLLHSDLKAVFDKVKAARDSVHDAATTLAKVAGVHGDENGESSTSTATSSQQ